MKNGSCKMYNGLIKKYILVASCFSNWTVYESFAKVILRDYLIKYFSYNLYYVK